MLWLLLVTAPLLTWFLVWAWRKRQHLIGQFVQSRLLAQLTVGVSRWRLKARLVLLGLAAMLILLALARPQLASPGRRSAAWLTFSWPWTPPAACSPRTFHPAAWRAPGWPPWTS